VVGILHAEAKPDAPRRAGWIERLCDLSLAGLGPGSVQVFLDLPAGSDGLFAEEDQRLLKDALSVLFDGLEWAAQPEQAIPATLERLPQPTQLAVLGVVARLLPPQTGPLERIGYRRRSDGPGRPSRRATLTRQSRQRIQTTMTTMERLAADRKFTEAEGVIRQIDLDAQTFVLRERPDGQDDLPCEYSGELAETVKVLFDCRVKVSGLLETSRMTRRAKMEAEAIELFGGDESEEQPEDIVRRA
jgi:hypothetical protein